VAAKHIPFLVEKFYQVDQGRSQSKDSKIDRGLGIGMSIIAEFCKLHGASLDIISDTNQGFETSIEFLKK
jgi:signal transduction histidine kinase